MAQYLLRRVIQAIPILIGVSMIVFLIVYASPGDAYTMRKTIIETPMRMGIAWMTRRSRYWPI